jgi:pantoate--beta-alanine ligase
LSGVIQGPEPFLVVLGSLKPPGSIGPGREEHNNSGYLKPSLGTAFLFGTPMEILGTVSEIKRWSKGNTVLGDTIGLVPTMGALHEGHLSLVNRARSENKRVVVSIFVNPAQFGPSEDFGSYPRLPQEDLLKCDYAGVDAIFMPEPSEIYGSGFQTYIDVTKLSVHLCGASRPGHFRGVATVVLKLFNIVKPTSAYFGLKDYQQVQVIKAMVRDLNLDVQIVSCPTVREPDGLAMSSRNAYLGQEHRKQALCLYEALMIADKMFSNGESSADNYLAAMKDRISIEPSAKIDYLKVVDPYTLEDLGVVGDQFLAVMAVRIGSTRLIDNMCFEK